MSVYFQQCWFSKVAGVQGLGFICGVMESLWCGGDGMGDSMSGFIFRLVLTGMET